MPLTDHLGELRGILVKALICLLVTFSVAYYYSEVVVHFLTEPLLQILPSNEKFLYFTGIADKFIIYLKVSFMVAVVIALPYLLYLLWTFVSPGLYDKEKKLAAPFVFFATLSFLIGLAFAYYIVIPVGYKFLIQFGSPNEKPMITLTEYFSLTLKLLIGVGAIFEMPVVLMLLGAFGIVSDSFLRKFRKQAILVNCILAAVITPSPDAFSMLLVAIPLCVLYELSIWGVRWTAKKA